MMHKLRMIILALAMSSGCAYFEPLVQDFNIVSVQEETKLGQQMAAQVEKEMGAVSTHKQISEIGQKLVQALPHKDFDYEFKLIDDKSPNAFTIPGGKIYIHSGLLKFVESEDQLAGVIAHEIGHAFERHPTKALSRAYGVEYLSLLVFRNQASANQLQQLTMQLVKGGLITRYGREDERESDDIGVALLKRAGYDSNGLLEFLRKLQTLEKPGTRPPAFLSTHPPTPERILRLEQMTRPPEIETQNSRSYFKRT